MPKYLITWNGGYGSTDEVVECADQKQADEAAYQAWRNDAENAAEYEARELTSELAEEYGYEHELED